MQLSNFWDDIRDDVMHGDNIRDDGDNIGDDKDDIRNDGDDGDDTSYEISCDFTKHLFHLMSKAFYSYLQSELNLGSLVIYSDAYLTELTWQVLVEGYLTSL